MTTQARDSESRARILRAALMLFQRNGYEGTSLKKVANEIGISAPALYWHFDSKEQLYFEAMRQLLDDFVGYVYARVTADAPPDRLRELVHAHVMFQLEEQELAGAFMGSLGVRSRSELLSDTNRATLVKKQREYVDEVRGILQSGQSSGDFRFEDLRVATFAVISHCEAVQSWFNPAGELTAEQVAQQYSRLALSMVGWAK